MKLKQKIRNLKRMNPELHADEERRMSDLFQGSFTGKEAAPAVVARLKHRRISTRGNVHERQRIGIMGGTFDPIHNGHLVAASEVAWVYDLDEVIFVPTGRPVFKLDKKVTNAEDRYLMTVIATASNPKFTVSRVDIDRPGVTYTIDTLRDIHAQHPDAELFFITGADAVAEIMQWKRAREMWNLARFVAVTRPGYSRPEKLADSNSPLLPREPHTNDTGVVVHCDDMVHCDAQHLPVDILEIPALSISSTDVRRRAEHGEPVWYLVPDGVVQYIVKHGLYRA
nr:nicotinate-nucleotide adenylyltransferase [Gardnerella vaginalis]